MQMYARVKDEKNRSSWSPNGMKSGAILSYFSFVAREKRNHSIISHEQCY